MESEHQSILGPKRISPSQTGLAGLSGVSERWALPLKPDSEAFRVSAEVSLTDTADAERQPVGTKDHGRT